MSNQPLLAVSIVRYDYIVSVSKASVEKIEYI